MLISCWSAKGGVGTTVVATGLALVLAAKEPAGAVLADLAGDVPTVLGLAHAESAGLAGWLAAGSSVPADALARLEVPVAGIGGLTVLPRGPGRLDAERAGVLATLLRRGNRPVVVDCGLVGPAGGAGPAAAREVVAREVVASAAVPSLLVTRPCYLALQRYVGVGPQPSGVVVVREPGRALGRHDVEAVVGVPVVAEVETDPAVSRAVDAGLVAAPRQLRSLLRALRHAV